MASIIIKVPFSPKLCATLRDEAPEGVTVHIPPIPMKRGYFDHAPIIDITLTLARDVSVSLFVAWLLKKFERKPPTTKITMRRREIEWDEGKLRKAIEEELQIEKKSDET